MENNSGLHRMFKSGIKGRERQRIARFGVEQVWENRSLRGVEV